MPGSRIGARCAPRSRRRRSSSGPSRWPGWRRCAHCRPSPRACSSTCGLDTFDLLFPPLGGRVAAAVLKAIVLFAAVSALIFAVLAPGAPQWRLVALAETPTRRVGWLLCAITAVYAIDAALTEILARVLRAAGAQRRADVRGERGLRGPADRPAADALHAASRRGTCRGEPSRAPDGWRGAALLAARSGLAQAAAVADRARHPGAGAARLRGARALPGPAAGDDRHRRRRELAALSRHPRGDARSAAAALPGRRDARGALRPRCAAPQSAGAADRDRAHVRPRHLRRCRS